MTRHEETKKIVRAPVEPSAVETMVLADAVRSEPPISTNATVVDTAVEAHAGAPAMREKLLQFSEPKDDI